MADDKSQYQYVDIPVDKIEAGMLRLQAMTEKSVETFTKIGEAVEVIASKVDALSAKPIVSDASLANAKSVEEFVSKLPKGMDLRRKQAEGLFRLTKLAGDLQKKIENGSITSIKQLLKEYKKILSAVKDISKESKLISALSGVTGFSWKDMKNTSMKDVAQQITGLNISLGGLVALMIEAYNQARLIGGYARKAAGALGDGEQAVRATKGEMTQLRKEFALEYNEAGNVVNEITSMGFRLRDVNTTTEKQVSLTQELYALQVKYGISVNASGGFVKNMEQEFGATTQQARDLLGVAIKTGTELRDQGVPIGIEELIQDWGTLIDKTKAYRTDLLGVLSLYNTLMKEDIADKLGLGGVSKSIKMDIAKTMTSMALDMELGWKARLGEGASPAERAIRFEKDLVDNPAKAFKRVVEEVEGMVGDIKANPYEAEIRSRMLLGQITGKGEKDPTVVTLSRLLAEGKMSSSKMAAFVKTQEDEKTKLEENRKAWNEGRVNLVKDAGGIAKSIQSVDQLIKKWALDKLMPLVLKIVKLLEEVIRAVRTGPVTGKRADVYKMSQSMLRNLGKFAASDEQIEQLAEPFAGTELYKKQSEKYGEENAAFVLQKTLQDMPSNKAAAARIEELLARGMEAQAIQVIESVYKGNYNKNKTSGKRAKTGTTTVAKGQQKQEPKLQSTPQGSQ